MTSALHHRGPDSRGIWVAADGSVALGHTRLAIVDLSEQGQQPMTSHSGRYRIVFNGEIYNHLELRRLIENQRPTAWRGHSDTETLLAAIDLWGLEISLQRSVGMFALGLWDEQSRTLFLARDRMGEKPLYYCAGHKGITFASEIKALRSCEGFDASLDLDAIRHFLEFGFIPGSTSVYAAVRKVPPASILRFDAVGSAVSSSPYWILPAPTARGRRHGLSPQEREEHLDTLERLLRNSIRNQMLADVPVGVFLSGGIDSTLIVALMQQQSSRPVRTFSMGFGVRDELSTARRTAGALGTAHTELVVTPKEAISVIPQLCTTYDEPFADASQIPTMMLSRLTRAHVTVALTGDAGDELFGGYNRYVMADRMHRWDMRWPRSSRVVVGKLLAHMPTDRTDSLARIAQMLGLRGIPTALGEKLSRISQTLQTSDPKEAYLIALSQWNDPTFAQRFATDLPTWQGSTPAELMMSWDIRGYLTDDILVKVDRAAMAASLETRVPLLDHRIVEFAVQTPMELKIRGGRSKWMLRQLLARHLPSYAASQPKQGFTLPLGAWLRGPLKEWAMDLLDQPSQLDGIIDRAVVENIWSEHLLGRGDHHRAIWTILMLKLWLANTTTNR